MAASHRTRNLTPLKGPASWIRDLRHQEAWRQVLAGVLILLYTATADVSMGALLGIGIVLAVVGTAFRFYASGYINKNAELATGGPYALVRHPLYTGNILTVIGFTAANAHWWAIVVTLLFFWFYYPPAIRYEDSKLRRLFGDAWERWAARTPALLPSLRNGGGLTRGHWSARISFRKNGEIAILVFVIACIVALIIQGT